MRSAFAAYADTHSAGSIRRCWSTFNTLCIYLFTADLLEANPMPLIGRPRVPKTLPKGYRPDAVTELVAAIEADRGSTRRADWPERDRVIVFTALLAGLRADDCSTPTSATFAKPSMVACCLCGARATRIAEYPWVPNCST